MPALAHYVSVKETRLSVLVIESNPDQVQLLEEAFTEMEEERFSRPAYPACHREYALDWLEGVDLLAASAAAGPSRPPDAILIDISADAPAALLAFQSLRAAAPGSAIVLLAAPPDEATALALVRQGAQDYLLASDLDCAPLARALRCGVERSRLQYARDSVSLRDDLTGLLNARGIAAVAERDQRLADALGLEPWLIAVQLHGSRDLDRLELADRLNELTAAGPAAGRTGDNSFLIAGLAVTSAEAQAVSGALAGRIETLARARGMETSFEITTGHAQAGLACAGLG